MRFGFLEICIKHDGHCDKQILVNYSQKQYRQRISLGQSNNALTMLIIINLVMFVLLSLIYVFFVFIYREDGQAQAVFQEKILKWFVLPSNLSELSTKPWTVFTYMFAHTRVLHILGNTLWLWAFGYIMQDLTGNRKIIPVFYLWWPGGCACIPGFL